jgi:NhaP-type Na+/H+ or K+/H+ antiporter
VTVDPYEAALAVAGFAALAAAWLPSYLDRRPMSLPVVLVAIGALVFVFAPSSIDPRPSEHLALAERLTEMGVIVALMGAGLKIDRPFRWSTWTTTWRLLAITMPLTIGSVAIAGWAIAGLPMASALLLGAILAPTDPVLASDVQVGEPTIDAQGAADPEQEDEVRFALTSEGGLNDALAFPFVYLAILVAAHGWDPGELAAWLGWDMAGRVAIGAVIGLLVGRALGVISFHPPGRLVALGDTPQGFVAIAATLLAYGVTEVLQGYGFLAVFVAAVAMRREEPRHELHAAMHNFVEQAENLFVVALLLLFGGALVRGVVAPLTWSAAIVALLVVFVARPAAGALGLLHSRLDRSQRSAIAFFGIRGFGSVYYLAYALGQHPFAAADELWAILALTMAVSIVVHGVTATPAMRVIEEEAASP